MLFTIKNPVHFSNYTLMTFQVKYSHCKTVSFGFMLLYIVCKCKMTDCTLTYSNWTKGVLVSRLFANIPLHGLILLLAHRLRPLTKWWAVAKDVDKAVAMAAQAVALS